MSSQYLSFANKLTSLEMSLSNNKCIYDFHISKEKTEENHPLLYFKIRFNDYECNTSSQDIELIYDTALDIAEIGKKIGYHAAIIDIKTISNNVSLYHRLI